MACNPVAVLSCLPGYAAGLTNKASQAGTRYLPSEHECKKEKEGF